MKQTDAQQPLILTDGKKITLTQMLAARDERMQRQHLWLNQHRSTIISLTLVIPGEIKNSSGAMFLFQTALKVITNTLQHAQKNILSQSPFFLDTGLEALWAVNNNAQSIKQLCISIEQTHPLGRYWDIDVICPQQGILSRQDTNIMSRKCLICENTAHACTRSRAHHSSELIYIIEQNINSYFLSDNNKIQIENEKQNY